MHFFFPQSAMHVPVILSCMINLSYNTYQMKNANREAIRAVIFSIPQELPLLLVQTFFLPSLIIPRKLFSNRCKSEVSMHRFVTFACRIYQSLVCVTPYQCTKSLAFIFFLRWNV
jgi:hypothetical protein